MGHGLVDEERVDQGGGLIREHILKYGVHDKLMSYPVAGTAVMRAFQAADSSFDA